MKLVIEKNILLENLNYVSRALSTRNIIPVLNGIKFDLTKEGLSLTATDNDISIKTFISKKEIKKIGEEGCIVIYGKSLIDIIRKLPNVDILIENFEENKVTFTTEKSKYDFNCFQKGDFPNIKFEENKNPIKLSSLKLKEIISNTSYACSVQESRPLLTGVNIKIIGSLFECIATDSYRLSKVSINIDNMIEESINIVIPSKNINELVKMLENDDVIEIHAFSNKVLFKTEKLLFQSSLLNGSYPNTDNNIPKEFKYEIKINSKEFFSILDRAALITQSKDKNIIEFVINKNELTINAASLEMGKLEEKMIVDNVTGENIKISFSARYMLDVLKITNSEYISVLLNGEIQPIIVKFPDNNELISLILPMKTY